MSTTTPEHDAIILAGGRGARLGGDKPNVLVGDRRLVDHALDAAGGARRVVVVGPAGLLDDGAAGDRVLVTREDPPFGGPAAGLAAGLSLLPGPQPDAGAVPVLLLACDVPLVGGLVVALLREWCRLSQEAGGPVDGVCTTLDGRAQWLVGVYAPAALRRATGAVHAAGGVAGAPLRRVVERLDLALLDDPGRLSTDVDSWDDVDRVRLLGRTVSPTDEAGDPR